MRAATGKVPVATRVSLPGPAPLLRVHAEARGADVKIVRRLRHASAKTTLDTYSHLWPDSDDSTRAAIDTALAARGDV
jgi:hypothetical protein